MDCLTIKTLEGEIIHQAVYQTTRRARYAGLAMLCEVYQSELGYSIHDISIRTEADLKEAYEKTIYNLRNEIHVTVRTLDQPYQPKHRSLEPENTGVWNLKTPEFGT